MERLNNGEVAVITPEQIRLLYDYNAWANRRTFDACSVLSDEQFRRDLGSSHGSIRDTVAHIMGAEWIWLERWQGRSPTDLPRQDLFADHGSLLGHWTEIERDLLQFVSSLTQEELIQNRQYRTTEGTPYSQPLWEMLQHLVNHGTYHRGQVATMLRQLNVNLPSPISLCSTESVYRGNCKRCRVIYAASP